MYKRSFTRRDVLGGIAGGAAAGLVRPDVGHAADADADSPFRLGVASGDPDATSVVLWTRLVFPETGWVRTERGPIDVRWRLFGDENLKQQISSGVVVAHPSQAHAVHVEAGDLQPDRWYWYLFEADGQRSPIGRTRTFPRPDAAVSSARCAIASCQHYEDGFFAAFRHMSQDDNDFVLHLGDYIYEGGGIGAFPVRRHGAGVPTTLQEYRDRYALYRSDPDLQAAHAACPWLVIWDDHEVDNDYAGAQSQDKHPHAFFLKRRAAAYQAFYEHMPLRGASRPRGAHLQLYRRADYGRLASMFLMDCRQYRSPQACNPAHSGGSRIIGPCAELHDPNRSMLGRAQERWLIDGLTRSRATWTILAQTTLMAKLDRDRGDQERYSNDVWDGYPASRQKIVDALSRQNVSNPLVFGGDLHAFFVADLKADFADARSGIVASEFVTSSISSANPRHKRYAAYRAKNPHIRHVDGSRRGYLSCHLQPGGADVQLKGLVQPREKGSAIETIAHYQVAAGRPGAIKQ